MRTELKVAGCAFLLFLFLFACKSKKEKHTDSGMKYEVYKENPGPKAKAGDFVTVEMVYKTEADSILFNSGQNSLPMRFQLRPPPFLGSMEEGLTYMAEGDSATFYVSADSMVRKVFAKRVGAMYVRPAFLKTGSFLKFDLKLVRIQNQLDAGEEMYRDLDERSALENESIKRFINNYNASQQPDSNGIYVIRIAEGTGAVIDSGKVVSVNYTGKFLNGEVFDSNKKRLKPFSFLAGRGAFVKGWHLAFKKLRQGDRATLIIPSALAYGEEGLRNELNGTFIVPPNTPLLYEVEVVEVK